MYLTWNKCTLFYQIWNKNPFSYKESNKIRPFTRGDFREKSSDGRTLTVTNYQTFLGFWMLNLLHPKKIVMMLTIIMIFQLRHLACIYLLFLLYNIRNVTKMQHSTNILMIEWNINVVKFMPLKPLLSHNHWYWDWWTF